jgi:molybdopterin synthase catalytic subunit
MIRIQVQTKDFSADSELLKIKNWKNGAVVTFIGRVRGEKGIVALDYACYREMALRELKKLSSEAVRHFGVNDIVIIHRTGALRPGDNVVFVLVCAAHRKGAFRACEWLIDNIKKTVPIWKKEIKRKGEKWL